MILIAVALLVASLIRFLVFVFFEVPLFAVIPVMRLVILAFAHTLLVCFVFRIIWGVVLEERSRHSLYGGTGETDSYRYCQNSGKMFEICSHAKSFASAWPFRLVRVSREQACIGHELLAHFV